MKPRFGRINEQFDNGDPISNGDLQYYCEKLEDLDALLNELGHYPSYSLMHNDVRRRLEHCYGYRRARQEKY